VKTKPAVGMEAHSYAAPEDLDVEERLLHEQVTEHYNKVLAGQSPEQLIVTLVFKAGSGKSELIETISVALLRMAEEAGVAKSPILRAASTAAGAANISGRTLHDLFHIPRQTSNHYMILTAESVQTLQDEFRDVTYM
jgi:hypothetical protein